VRINVIDWVEQIGNRSMENEQNNRLQHKKDNGEDKTLKEKNTKKVVGR